MTHVEHLVHFLPVSSRLLLNQLKQRRHWEKVVLYDVLVGYEVHNLGLSSSRAVNHAMNVVAHSVEQFLDYWSIGAGRRKHQLASVYVNALYTIG